MMISGGFQVDSLTIFIVMTENIYSNPSNLWIAEAKADHSASSIRTAELCWILYLSANQKTVFSTIGWNSSAVITRSTNVDKGSERVQTSPLHLSE